MSTPVDPPAGDADPSDVAARHASPEPPAWWLQYRKAVLAGAVGLLATLTDLAASWHAHAGLTTGDGLHAGIVLVSTVLSTAGVAAVSNVYPVPVLRAKLAAATPPEPPELQPARPVPLADLFPTPPPYDRDARTHRTPPARPGHPVPRMHTQPREPHDVSTVLIDENGVKRITLPWTSDTYAGGRHVAHDPRSLAYRADVSGLKPADVIHAHVGGVLNQGKLGSCTGNSGAQCLNTYPLHRPGDKVWKEADAVQLYADATAVDPFPGTYPPDDTGSSGLAVGKVLQARKVITRYEWGFGIDDTTKLATTDVLSIGIEWTNDMFTPDDQGYLHPTGAVAGGHQPTIRGVNFTGEWVLILNSWGAGWGGWVDPKTGKRLYPGHARMKFADLEALLKRNGDVVRFVR